MLGPLEPISAPRAPKLLQTPAERARAPDPGSKVFVQALAKGPPTPKLVAKICTVKPVTAVPGLNVASHSPAPEGLTEKIHQSVKPPVPSPPWVNEPEDA